ncbi:SDR family oxidoreductase [Kutzneria sp. CA-103260]|uniref:SDR family oxidoreductase n=1 Tax=Kutzneria sp. CA-103260 TaxID=2802641 RepID=UPI001BAA891B|nr:SDR family oxidoreductase [Kutzneria sp. CA-103260]QUQ64110.1 ketoreductase [Kutzneria sp. CA-103260]
MNVIVTGAAGLVGAEVCVRLAVAGHNVLGLTHHRKPPFPTTPSVQWFAADVTRPDLGLPPRSVDRLRADRCVLVHAAAVTAFGRDDSVYDAVNVGGTAHALALAGRGEMPFVHISTAYVDQPYANGYERSKAAAESLVHGSGVDAVVIRPSIVVGAEATGAIRLFRHMYVLLRLVLEGKVGVLPGRYDACLDLVPVDRVADLVTDVVQRFGEVRNSTLPAIAGSPVTLRECSEVFAEYPSFRVPRFVPPDVFRPDALPDTQRRYHDRVVRLYEPYLRSRTVFDDSATRAFHGRRPELTGVAHLRRLLDYCLAMGYLR